MVTTQSPPDDLRLPVDVAAPGLARRWIRGACADLSPDQQSVAELLTSELVTNAVRHPARHAPAGALARSAGIVVRVRRRGRDVRVEVHDEDPAPLPPPRRSRVPAESGMGLVLVAELATRWGSTPVPTGQGKVVWFELQQPTPHHGT